MKIICLGDSFTFGFGVKKEECWVSRLNTAGRTFVNKGINGDTTSGMLARFDRDVLSHSPNYVLITGGINDFISGGGLQIPQNNYMAMVHQAFYGNIIPIVGIAPGFDPELIRKDWAAFQDFHQVLTLQRQLRAWLLEFCQTFGLYSIDFYKFLEEAQSADPDKNFFLDGLHLIPEGHKLLAEAASHRFRPQR